MGAKAGGFSAVRGSVDEVEAEGDGGVGTEGYSLFGNLAEGVVLGQEELEADGGDAEVGNPAEAAAEGTDGTVDGQRDVLHGEVVGREAEVGPGVVTGDAGGVQQAEGDLAVHRQGVFGAEVEGSVEHLRAPPLITHVVELVEFLEVVAQAVPFVVEGVGGVVV